ncbi:MAG: hypothetical protein WA874_04220 [Chryseosolibacter sp.]
MREISVGITLTKSSPPPAWQVFMILVALFITHVAASQTVYITRTGEKYHDDGCRYLSRSQIKTTLQDAVNDGYTACSICKPPTKVTARQQSISAPAPPAKKATSTQCTARTKSNTRCSRTTTNSNGKCWQHQ